MIPVVAIAGTWGWRGSSKGQWYDPASPWSVYVREQGFEHLHLLGGDPRPFVWSTDINGQRPWRRWMGFQDTVDWQCGGQNLYAWLVPPRAPERCQPPAMTHLVAHSHALQVALFACADGLKINTLISIGSPVRADMIAVAERARPNIGYWVHVHSDGSDRMQWVGEFGDGVLRVARAHPLADWNLPVPDVGHSRILHDEKFIPAVWPQLLHVIRFRHGLVAPRA